MLLLDPGVVIGSQWRQRAFRGSSIGQVAERRHAQFHLRHLDGLRLLDVGRRNPTGEDEAAGSVGQLPVRRNPVAGCVFGRIGVMQIRDALIGIVARAPARIGPRDERHCAAHLQPSLKRERLVARSLGCRGSVIHQEHRHGARPRSDPVRKALSVHRMGDHVEN